MPQTHRYAPTQFRHPESCPSQSAPLPRLMHHFPHEILQHIFNIYVHSSDDPSYSPLTLTHVCRLWRLTTCSYGGLWTSIHVSPHACCPHRLRVWLDRAKKYPLDIVITLPSSPFVSDWFIIPRVHSTMKELLLPVCAQWRSLSIEGSSKAVLSLGQIIPPFENPTLVGLASLSITKSSANAANSTPDHGDLAYSPLVTLPHLRSLSLSSCRPRLNHSTQMAQLCERITHLRLHHLVLPIDELYAMLGSCRSLESLEMDDLMTIVPLDNPLLYQVVRGPDSNANTQASLVPELPKLKSLSVNDYMSYRILDEDTGNFELTAFMLVGWLKCPRLEELKLCSALGDMSTRQSDALFQCLQISGYPAVRRLLVRGCAMDSLEYATLTGAYGGEAGLSKCLRSVEELELCEAWMSNANLRILGRVCPRLRVLRICWCTKITEDDILSFVASQVVNVRELTVAPAHQDLKARVMVATKGLVQVRIFTKHAMASFHAQHCLS